MGQLNLFDLFPEDEFIAAAEAGLISRREHPTEPLVIYNYTAQCQYQRAWNQVTRQCRGLIATLPEIGNVVVSRPFPKFFNHGEPDAPPISLDDPVRVTDKLDGSLGILYPTSSGFAIATRGSFESDQAAVATELLQEYVHFGFRPMDGFTYLFEIIYPENRIVVDYAGVRDLYLLAVLETETGFEMHGNFGWTGPTVDVMPYKTFADALAAEPRPNSEGLVVSFHQDPRSADGVSRVKIKQDDYVQLHRIVTGLSARVVWEQMGEHKTLAEIIEPLPDEFHGWVTDIWMEIMADWQRIDWRARSVFHDIKKHLGSEWTRKDFALEAVKPEYEEVRPYLFMLLDVKDPWDAIHKSLRPEGVRTPREFSEDVA